MTLLINEQRECMLIDSQSASHELGVDFNCMQMESSMGKKHGNV